MAEKNKHFQRVILFLGIIMVLACSSISISDGGGTDPSVVQTEIAFGIMSTNLANNQMTLQALQVQMTQQAAYVPPTQTSAPPQAPPTQNILPSPSPTFTSTSTPAPLVLEIQKSVGTFYCYQSPYELIITVRVSDINRGMAVYYRIQDKKSNVASDWQSVDLHRRLSNDTRTATIIGGGSSQQNLQFPPLMGESYFLYQIISDDNGYRSQVYSDITFFPCGQ
jgi:hypothetical protein